MNKLAKHILTLLHHGYPIQLLYNFDTAREALRQNGIEASRGQVKCALKKHFVAIYEAFTGSRIITGSQFPDAFAGANNWPNLQHTSDFSTESELNPRVVTPPPILSYIYAGETTDFSCPANRVID